MKFCFLFLAMAACVPTAVLSMGGGTHPSEVFRAFRGRDPSPDALLKHNGLA